MDNENKSGIPKTIKPRDLKRMTFRDMDRNPALSDALMELNKPVRSGVSWVPGTMHRADGTIATICKCVACGAWGTAYTECCDPFAPAE